MSVRDEINHFPLGQLESGERYVGCLHFREGVGYVRAAWLWHAIATFAAQRFGDDIEIDDAEICREYNVGACEFIYDDAHAVADAAESGTVR